MYVVHVWVVKLGMDVRLLSCRVLYVLLLVEDVGVMLVAGARDPSLCLVDIPSTQSA